MTAPVVADAPQAAQGKRARTHQFVQAKLSRRNVIGRAVWSFVWIFLFRPTPRPLHRWRCWLLRCFGADIGDHVRVYQTVKVWAPWNLTMHDGSCLGDHVDCYCVAKITLEKKAVVSQYSYLCSASRDYRDVTLPLIHAPITIGEHAWITADVFVGPGVHVGEGAIATARSTVLTDIEPWTVASGNPAVPIKRREFKGDRRSDQTVAADQLA